MKSKCFVDLERFHHWKSKFWNDSMSFHFSPQPQQCTNSGNWSPSPLLAKVVKSWKWTIRLIKMTTWCASEVRGQLLSIKSLKVTLIFKFIFRGSSSVFMAEGHKSKSRIQHCFCVVIDFWLLDFGGGRLGEIFQHSQMQISIFIILYSASGQGRALLQTSHTSNLREEKDEWTKPVHNARVMMRIQLLLCSLEESQWRQQRAHVSRQKIGLEWKDARQKSIASIVSMVKVKDTLLNKKWKK